MTHIALNAQDDAEARLELAQLLGEFLSSPSRPVAALFHGAPIKLP
jgi:hypothetical protein